MKFKWSNPKTYIKTYLKWRKVPESAQRALRLTIDKEPKHYQILNEKLLKFRNGIPLYVSYYAYRVG